MAQPPTGRYWNWFDLVLAAAGITDLAIQFVTASSAMVVEEGMAVEWK